MARQQQPSNNFNAGFCLVTEETQQNRLQQFAVFEVPSGHSATVKFSRSTGVSTFNVIPPTPPGAPAVSQLRTNQQQSTGGFPLNSFGHSATSFQQRHTQNSSGYGSDPNFGAQASPLSRSQSSQQQQFPSTPQGFRPASQLRSPQDQNPYFDSLETSQSRRSPYSPSAPVLSPIFGPPPPSTLMSSHNQASSVSRHGSPSAHNFPLTPIPPPLTSQLEQRSSTGPMMPQFSSSPSQNQRFN